MDRHDEMKDRTDEVGESLPPRQGDILGLGGTSVPKAADDPAAEHDPASVTKRRARAFGEEEEPRTGQGTPDHQGGAASIDMGAGGQGNLIRRRE